MKCVYVGFFTSLILQLLLLAPFMQCTCIRWIRHIECGVFFLGVFLWKRIRDDSQELFCGVSAVENISAIRRLDNWWQLKAYRFSAVKHSKVDWKINFFFLLDLSVLLYMFSGRIIWLDSHIQVLWHFWCSFMMHFFDALFFYFFKKWEL